MKRTIVIVATALAAVSIVACGGGSDTPAAGPTTAATTPPPPVAVKAIDYGYEGLPTSAKPGTKLTLTNASAKEAHELVAVRLPDTEKRPAADLVKDPAAMGPLMSGGPPAAVIVVAPSSSQPGPVVGDGSLASAGRYLLLCNIPTGADPVAFLEAAKKSTGGPPQVPGGPPHFTKGMVAEITIAA